MWRGGTVVVVVVGWLGWGVGGGVCVGEEGGGEGWRGCGCVWGGGEGGVVVVVQTVSRWKISVDEPSRACI